MADALTVGRIELSSDHSGRQDLACAELWKHNDAMAEKLHKVAAWLDRLAESAEEGARTCRINSLVSAYEGDARNYRTTAADIRSVLPKAERVVG